MFLQPKKLPHRLKLQRLSDPTRDSHINPQAFQRFSVCVDRLNETLHSFGEILMKSRTTSEKSDYLDYQELASERSEYELEERFQKVEMAIPKIQRHNKKNLHMQTKKWLGELLKTVLSVAFKLYLNETFSQKQTKIFCCENLLYNIIKFVERNDLDRDDVEFINQSMKKDLIPYFLLKYPQSEAREVNLRLSNWVSQIDNSYSNSNDFIYASGVKFTYEPNSDYNSKIMQFLNYIIQLPGDLMRIDTKLELEGDISDPKEDEMALYNAFHSDFENLFRKIEDETEVIRMKTYMNQKKKYHTGYQVKKDLKKKQAYQEKVKEYTKYLIGRKLPQSVSEYTEQQIRAGNLKIRNTQILRILTKWCHELEKYFDDVDEYILDRQEQFRMKDGSEQYLKKTHRILLKKLIEKEKKHIHEFLNQVMENNYLHQKNFMKKKLDQQMDCYSHEESTVGLFTAVMFKNNQNYIKGYLNTLIHCLMTVELQFETIAKVEAKKGKKINNKIESVCTGKMDISELLDFVENIKIGVVRNFEDRIPSLLSFKISDLIRCKCSSRQYQITALYNEIHKISQQRPELFKIVRIKNRLEKGTKDILINLRYRQKILMEVQLAINPEKSKFIQYSDHFNHFLYELERAEFGPISEMSSVWINSDNRASFYRSKFNEYNIRQETDKKIQHNCQDVDYLPENLPFFCSFCKFYWTNQNTIEKHYKCNKCQKHVCSLCSIHNFEEEYILSRIEKEIQTQINQNEKVQFCNYIPDYGASINLFSKEIKLKFFRKVMYSGKQYLFEEIKKRNDYDHDLLANISSQALKNKFIKKNLIVKLEGKKQISDTDIAQKFFVPKYIFECFKKEKMSILLQKQGIKKSFFNDISEYKNVTKVNFSENQIRQSKWIIDKFPSTSIMVLSENKLDKIDKEIYRLDKLSFLNLNSNHIKQLPLQISTLPHITYLTINNNQLIELPKTFSELSSLKYFYAAFNRLSQLPALPQGLKVLDLNHNRISEIKLENLTRLKFVNLDHNKLTKLEGLASLTDLETLTLAFNSISGQFLVENLTNLENLLLSYNNLTGIKIQFQNPSAAKLKNLDIGFNKITSLKDNFYNSLLSLENFSLPNNKVIYLSENIKKLVNLKELNISSIFQSREEEEKKSEEERSEGTLNQEKIKKQQEMQEQISEKKKNMLLPEDSDAFFKNLQILNISKNQLKKVPPYIQFLKQLRQLDISNNSIQEITSPINAEIIDLSYNELSIFNADTADKFRNVKQLCLKGNNLKFMSHEDLKRMINLEELDIEDNTDIVWIDAKKILTSGRLIPNFDQILQKPKTQMKSRHSEDQNQQQKRKQSNKSRFVKKSQVSFINFQV